MRPQARPRPEHWLETLVEWDLCAPIIVTPYSTKLVTFSTTKLAVQFIWVLQMRVLVSFNKSKTTLLDATMADYIANEYFLCVYCVGLQSHVLFSERTSAAWECRACKLTVKIHRLYTTLIPMTINSPNFCYQTSILKVVHIYANVWNLAHIYWSSLHLLTDLLHNI